MKYWLAATIALCVSCRSRVAEAPGLRTLPGFHVEAVAAGFGEAALFTFDSSGRLIAAKASGPAVLLSGASAQPPGVKLNSLRAMWFDGRTLYAVGKNEEGRAGFYKSGESFEQLAELDFAGGMRRGPDGAPVALFAGLSKWNEDRRSFVPVATGLRGSGHAFNLEGEAFVIEPETDDAANLPWHRSARLVHAIPGGDYGWDAGRNPRAAYFFDSLPPVKELGGGRPGGLEFYQHRIYPREYAGALFHGGGAGEKILVSKVVRDGAKYKIDGTRPFVEGIAGLNGLEVGPDGFLYFSATSGIYRVRYDAGLWTSWFGREAVSVVNQPQPVSSWGHAALEKAKETMGPRWGEELEQVATNAAADPADRVQALLLLQRFGPAPGPDLLRSLSGDRMPTVRAAAMLVAGMHSSARAKAIAAAGFKDVDPFVRRRAAEAAVRQGLSPEEPSFVPIDDVWALLRDSDRFVRYAGRLALERIAVAEWQAKALAETNPDAALEGMLAWIRVKPGEVDSPVFDRVLDLMRRGSLTRSPFLGTLRLFTLATAQERGGASASLRKQVSDILLPRFPSGDAVLDRELVRVLAACGQPEALAKILAAIPKGEAGQPEQIHFIQCLAAVKEGWTAEQKTELVRWFAKASAWRSARFLAPMFHSMLEPFSEAEKQAAYRQVPAFAPAPSGRR